MFEDSKGKKQMFPLIIHLKIVSYWYRILIENMQNLSNTQLNLSSDFLFMKLHWCCCQV